MVRKHAGEVRVGDRIRVHGHRVGEAQRSGEIIEVLGEGGDGRYRVRWEDGHESISYPSNDAVIERPRGSSRPAAASR